MDIRKMIEILEAPAFGCSPATGEVVDNESVLNERDLIRALQIVIDRSYNELPQGHPSIDIPEEDIKTAIALFQQQELAPTYSRFTGFFLATRTFEDGLIHSSKLYGKYHGRYQKDEARDFWQPIFMITDTLKHGKKVPASSESEPWKAIGFFRRDHFNNLSENATMIYENQILENG